MPVKADFPPVPSAILFDWDNTLVDNWGAIHEALNLTLAAMGHPTWTYDETRLRVQRSLRDSFPQMFGERWREAGDLYLHSFAEVHLRTLRPMPGADALLRELSRCGIYLAVVSNKTGRFLRLEAAHLGWDSHFRRLIGATDAPKDKPAVEPVDLALADSGIDRNAAVWFVGDGAVDVECARNAGLSAILVGDNPTGDVAAETTGRNQQIQWVPDCFALAGLVRRYSGTISQGGARS
jgi:phosphoglycolate phosphatase